MVPGMSDSDSDGAPSPNKVPTASTYDYTFVADKTERRKLADGMQKHDLKRLSRSPCKRAPIESDGPQVRDRSPVRKMVRGFVLRDEAPAGGDPSK